ncbi:MAG: NADH-ubiquinone/plastoquinone oxidoreductase chain 6, partial [Nitrospirae bacterium CG08_land_8_20_14_0_20_52_24]
MFASLFFDYLFVMILTSAVLMITRKHIVHAVLYMLLMFFHIAGLYILLEAEFLAAVQLIVYAGAILVLYLFVIMLVNIRKLETLREQLFGHLPFALVSAGLLCAGVVGILMQETVLKEPSSSVQAATQMSNPELLGQALYTQ